VSLQSRIQVAGQDGTEPEAGQEPSKASVPERVSVVSDPFADLKTRVHKDIIARLGPRLFNSDPGTGDNDLEATVNEAVTEVLALEKTPLTRQERQDIIRQISDDILGYGPLEPFLRDDSITEIMVNDCRTIYIERHGKITRTNAQFVDDQHLLRIIDKIISRIGRRIDESSPYVDARLPDGSRVNAIIPPLAVRGSALTIRKFRKDPFTMPDLIKFGTLTHKSGQFLEACVRGKLNILISGGTGSGKTTTLNVLSAAIPSDERIITVEDAAELQLKQEHVITLESRPANIEGKGQVTIRDLVRNTLRMRPDRIIIGECRGPETVDMLQAMNTGHDGSLTTVHANNPRDALARTETLVLTAGVDLPLRAIREQISSAFDLVVQVSRLVDGTRRITHVTEVLRMESDVVTLQDVFIAKPVENAAEQAETGHRLLGPLTCTGIKPHFLDKMAGNGVNLPPNFFLPETAGERSSTASAAGVFGRAVGQ
jgi:pilus assembly protein CpaF